VRAGLRSSGLMFTGLGYICKSCLGLCLQVWAFACRSGLVFASLSVGMDLQVSGLHLQFWACISRSGVGFASLGLDL